MDGRSDGWMGDCVEDGLDGKRGGCMGDED